MGIRQIRAAGFGAADNPAGVGDHERQVRGNEARHWYSQKGYSVGYTYIRI